MASSTEFNHFEQLKQALHQGVQKEAERSAHKVQKSIQATIRGNGQVETGNMEHSIYVKMHGKSDYPGSAGRDLLPEVEAPPSDTEAYIAAAASYAVDQNYGTRYVPARPFMEPGLFAERQGIIERLSHFERLVEDGGYRP